jgi:hypothetical protein
MKDSENFWQNLLMSEQKEVYGITQQRDCLCFFVNTDENTEEQGQIKQFSSLIFLKRETITKRRAKFRERFSTTWFRRCSLSR